MFNFATQDFTGTRPVLPVSNSTTRPQNKRDKTKVGIEPTLHSPLGTRSLSCVPGSNFVGVFVNPYLCLFSQPDLVTLW